MTSFPPMPILPVRGKTQSTNFTILKTFHSQTRDAFCFTGYDGEFTSGLALAIPYPHKELKQDKILAAAIENFAPAIMSDTLVLNVDNKELSALSITEIAEDVSMEFNDEAIRTDSKRYLHLINCASKEHVPVKIKWPVGQINFEDMRKKGASQVYAGKAGA